MYILAIVCLTSLIFAILCSALVGINRQMPYAVAMGMFLLAAMLSGCSAAILAIEEDPYIPFPSPQQAEMNLTEDAPAGERAVNNFTQVLTDDELETGIKIIDGQEVHIPVPLNTEDGADAAVDAGDDTGNGEVADAVGLGNGIVDDDAGEE